MECASVNVSEVVGFGTGASLPGRSFALSRAFMQSLSRICCRHTRGPAFFFFFLFLGTLLYNLIDSVCIFFLSSNKYEKVFKGLFLELNG